MNFPLIDVSDIGMDSTFTTDKLVQDEACFHRSDNFLLKQALTTGMNLFDQGLAGIFNESARTH